MLDIQTLKRFVPFNGLEDDYLQEALSKIEVQEYGKGQMLYKRGRAVATKYFLLEGQIDLINSAFYVSTVLGDSAAANSALNSESPTLCSAVAKSPSVRVFSIEAEVLDRLTAWSQSAVEEGFDDFEYSTGEFEVEEVGEEGGDWMAALLQAPLFSKVPLTQVQELFLRFEDVSLKKGDMVVKEGERGDYFYVLVSGSARVRNRSESVDLVVHPGQFFGEESLLGDTPRNASVEMESNGRLKRLNSEDFNALLKAPVVRYVESKVLDKMDKPYKLLDVKMPMEYRIQHMPGAINIPLSRLRNSLAELGRTNIYVVPDDAGSRADIAAHLLCQAGFDAVILKNCQAQPA
ncbi:cyclic nucleotide-binding domain-containing protein [Teredinibacter franksiae]|uniref:cyclic nucleotide-binding domain-containing protein n=1 Tax=Teredinibacter franksiae TaxID=2761453 RepID=UPI001626E7E2|nr:cyclic nucleotide-binding domain-containing protein [Teredinibacter franksiae]